MNRSMLDLPVRFLRTARTLAGRLAMPAKRAAALLDRTVHRPGPEPAESEVVSPPGAEVVVDPVPLPEPAADLDVEVTLPSELPIRRYDALNAADAAAAIKELTDAEEVRAVLRFEEENAKRKTVLAAAATHLTTLGQQTRR